MRWLTPILILFLASCQERDPWAKDPSVPATVSFTDHIRPLLARKLLTEPSPKPEITALLRKDLPLLRTLTNSKNPSQSPLWITLTEELPDPILSSEQALLWRWIRQGAPLEPHWAYLPVPLPTTPPLIEDNEPISQLQALQHIAILVNREATPEELNNINTNQPTRSEFLDQLLNSPEFIQFLPRQLLNWSQLTIPSDDLAFTPYLRWLDNQVTQPDFSLATFFTEALAGDLIPEAGQEGQLATAWLRATSAQAQHALASHLTQTFLALPPETQAHPDSLWPKAVSTLKNIFPDLPPPTNGHVVLPPLIRLQTPAQIKAIEEANKRVSELRSRLSETTQTTSPTFSAWLKKEARLLNLPDTTAIFSFDTNPPVNQLPAAIAKVISAPESFQLGTSGTALPSPAAFTGLTLSSSQPFTLSFFLFLPSVPKQPSPILSAGPFGFELNLSQEGIEILLARGSHHNALNASTTSTLLP
ncbi:MAG: hypothetical protein AAGC74_11895, partial [Verrucomicrobiota bacterium]